MKLTVKKKKLFFETISILIILISFAFGWLYLEFIFNIRNPFDFTVYLNPEEASVSQGKSTYSNIIVFSQSMEKYKTVELQISNCPKEAICTLSVNSANPTFTSELTVTPSESTPIGNYPLNILATGGGVSKTSTLYINIKSKECFCSDWVNEGCDFGCGLQMFMTRKCEPKGCNIESRCAYNYSCIKDFSIESIPNYSRVVDQKAYFEIKMTSINNFSGLVYLSVSNCPMGSVCSHSLSPVFVLPNMSATSLLTIKTALGAVVGDFKITSTGVSNNTIHSTNSFITIT